MVAGATFAWSATNTSFGLPSEGTGNITAFLVNNPAFIRDSSVVSVVALANGCFGPASAFFVWANPTPDVALIASQVLCSGSLTDTVRFHGDVAGTAFQWTNSDASIGLGVSGTGEIPSFSAVNLSLIKDTAHIIVTPVAAGCTGSSATFSIVVFPQPEVSLPANRIVCNGTAIAGIFLTGPLPGSSFSWTASGAVIGLTGGGIDSIPGFTGVNASYVPDTAIATIVVTQGGCTSPGYHLLYIVNPIPAVDTPILRSFCDGTLTDTLIFSGPVAGTAYSWTNGLPSIGLPAGGTGDILPFTVYNAAYVTDTVHLMITPAANGCTGAAVPFAIAVKPAPDVKGASNLSLCSGNAAAGFLLYGDVAGSVFNWTNNNTTIGLAAAGSGNIPGFSAVNSMGIPDTAIVVINSTADGCTGIPDTIWMVVNSSPTLNTSLKDSVCSGGTFAYTPGSATVGVSYNWKMVGATGLVPASSAGAGAIFQSFTNGTSNPLTATYVFTLSAASCTRVESVDVVVFPVPSAAHVDIFPARTLCSGTTYQNFGTNTPVGVWQFNWSSPDNAVVWAQGAGHQYCVVNFPTPGVATVVLSVGVEGTGCTSTDSLTFTVTSNVQETPPVVYTGKNFLCLLNSLDSYQWGFDDRYSLDSAIIPGETNQNYYNPTPDFNNKYYWVMTARGDCLQKTYVNEPTKAGQIAGAGVNFKVYPNPASTRVKIEMNVNGVAKNVVSVTDLTGRRIAAENVVNGSVDFDVSELTSGIYFLNFYSDGVWMGAEKLIKE